jgi:hypothetical protein
LPGVTEKGFVKDCGFQYLDNYLFAKFIAAFILSANWKLDYLQNFFHENKDLNLA